MRKLLPALLLCLFSVSTWGQIDPVSTHTVDTPPLFATCEAAKSPHQCSNQKLLQYIATQLNYPEAARLNGVEGTVVIGFTILASGRITDLEVKRDIGSGCGDAALSLVAQMPQWTPATKNGESVDLRMELPVHFYLDDASAEGKTTADRYRLTWGTSTEKTIRKKDLLRKMDDPMYVRDEVGNTLIIDEIVFIYERRSGNRRQTSGRDQRDRNLRKFVERLKPGGTLMVELTVQDQGRFHRLHRTYNVVL